MHYIQDERKLQVKTRKTLNRIYQKQVMLFCW